ncbi:MAG: PIN domain-containing protein [bacterium]
MEYLADTVAIIRHFAKYGYIGREAKKILEKADGGENIIWISIVSIIEIMYLAERNKIPLNLTKTREKIEDLDNYRIIDLDFDIVEMADKIKGLELHDRLIVASAKYLGLSILTTDKEIKEKGMIDVIWE